MSAPGDAEELLGRATTFLSSIDVDDDTPLDRIVLLTLLGLSIHTTRTIHDLSQRLAIMALNLDALTQASTDIGTGINDAIALIEQLAAGNNDPAVQAQVDSVTNALQTSTQALTTAVTANTPVDEPPAPAA